MIHQRKGAPIVSDRLDEYQRRRLELGRAANRVGRLMLWLGRTERRAEWVLSHMGRGVEPLLTLALRPRPRSQTPDLVTPDRRPSTTHDPRPTTLDP